MDDIKEFDGEYAFLSNFYPAKVEFEGHLYRTVEHAYQAAKSLNPRMRYEIRTADSPGVAKLLGQRCKLRPDWGEVKYDIMAYLVAQKFSQPYFKQLLLATGDAHIEEGNTWGDTIWGTVDGEGQNWLGIILMNIRNAARDGTL